MVIPSGLYRTEQKVFETESSRAVIMSDVKPKSCNKSDGRKATQFKKGNKLRASTLKRPERPNSAPVSEESPVAKSPKLERPTRGEAADIQYVCGSGAGEDSKRLELPYALRPNPEEEEKSSKNAKLSENIIVNTRNMADLINHMHAAVCESPRIGVKITSRIGLCVKVTLECHHCHYKSPEIAMSDTERQHKKGPVAGVLNSMAALPVLKSKVGVEDVRTVLTCLNVVPPSKRTLQNRVNKMSAAAIAVNEKQMEKNQEYVANITAKAGAKHSVDVQFDVAYTCRSQGGCEKAAQSFGALIEHTTGSKLPIAIATANKHCRKPGCKHDNCQKNFKSEASIASSERILLHRTLQKVDDAGHLEIGSITTDAGTQSAKAIRDYYGDRQNQPATYFKCLVHKMRALERHLKQLNLRSIPGALDKQAYTRKLASSIRARVRLELGKLRKQGRSDTDFIQMASAAIENIMTCFSGDHRLCRKHSRVCSGHPGIQYSHLPNNKAVKLSDADLSAVKMQIARNFDADGLRQVCKLFNTNICESLNAAVFNYAQKAVCWTRNFTALCHSATHSRTVGPGIGTVQLAEAAGIRVQKNSIMYTYLLAKDRIRKYHRLRKASAKYKQTRHILRMRKISNPLFKDSVYSSENLASCSATDHSYVLKS